jgi:hypothetical protein
LPCSAFFECNWSASYHGHGLKATEKWTADRGRFVCRQVDDQADSRC